MTVANDNELSAGDILTYAAHVVGCCVLWSLNLDFLYGSSLLIHAMLRLRVEASVPGLTYPEA